MNTLAKLSPLELRARSRVRSTEVELARIRRAAGLCPRCGGEPVPGSVLCRTDLDRRRAQQSKHRAVSKALDRSALVKAQQL